MGTKERRERERQAVRQNIMAAARAIAGREGWQAVSIRRVAERIEYSPPTIYEHFGGKEALLVELMREGFGILLAGMQRAAGQAAEPQARLLAIAQAYWAFAWEHPELYQVMHGLGGVPFCADPSTPPAQAGLAEADAVFEYVLGLLAELAPQLAGDDKSAAVMILWATLHGLVALTMAGQIEGGRDCAARLVERATRGVLAAHVLADPQHKGASQ